MGHFAGLDVLVKDTSVCIVDEVGKIVREVKVASEPDALLAVLRNTTYRFKRIGLEAGPLSQWLFSALAEAEFAGDLCRDASHTGGIEVTDQQDGSQRCPRHRADDTGGACFLAELALARSGHGHCAVRHLLFKRDLICYRRISREKSGGIIRMGGLFHG